MEVNFAFRRKMKMTATCNFVALGDKLHELLVKKCKRKKKDMKKRKITDHMIGLKEAQNVRTVLQPFLAADKAGQFKVSTAQQGVKKGAQFSKNA